MSRWYPYGTGELARVTTITAVKSSGCDGLMYWANDRMADLTLSLLISDYYKGWLFFDAVRDALRRSRGAHKQARDGAADIGTSVHDALEAWINGERLDKVCEDCGCGGSVPEMWERKIGRGDSVIDVKWHTCPTCHGTGRVSVLTEQTRPMFANAARWILRNVAYVEATETTVYNPEEGYAGRCDLVAVMCATDTKTYRWGKYSIEITKLPRYVIDFKTSSKIQEPATPMQCEAYAQAWPEPVDGTGALRIDRDTGEVEWKDFTHERAVSWRSFLECRNLFYRHDAKVAMRKAFIESEG